jgi:hypothetical protein
MLPYADVCWRMLTNSKLEDEEFERELQKSERLAI